MISLKLPFEISKTVVLQKTPLLNIYFDTKYQLDAKKTMDMFKLELRKITIKYKTIDDFERILKQESKDELNKKIDLSFFDYGDHSFRERLKSYIDNKETKIHLRGPSTQEILFYTLFVLQDSKDKVKIIENKADWDYYWKNKIEANSIVIATFCDELPDNDYGLATIEDCTNIFISLRNNQTENQLEIKNRFVLQTRTKLKEYTKLSDDQIETLISETYNLYTYYKKSLFKSNFLFGRNALLGSMKQTSVIPMLLFPISIEVDLHEDFNTVNKYFGEIFLNKYIDEHKKYVKKSPELKKYYIPSCQEAIFEAIATDRDNFKPISRLELNKFFDVVIDVLTHAPKWYTGYNKQQVTTISSGQNNYSEIFFKTLFHSIQILKETKLFDKELKDFYKKIYELNLDDTNKEYFIENSGQLIYICPEFCQDLYHDENSNFKNYIKTVFMQKSRKTIWGKEQPFHYVENYLESIMYHKESYQFLWDLIIDLQVDENYKESTFEKFIIHYFSGRWWNLPYKDEKAIEFCNKLKTSPNHRKLMSSIIKFFLNNSAYSTSFRSLDDSLGYEQKDKYIYASKELHDYFYNIVLSEEVEFEIIESFFSSNAKCYFHLFDRIINLLESNGFTTCELGIIEFHLVDFLYDIKKYDRKCEPKVLENIQTMVETIRKTPNYVQIIKFLIDETYENRLENPTTNRRKATHYDEESYKNQVYEAINTINWPNDLFKFIDELGIERFKNYRLFQHSFICRTVTPEEFVDFVKNFKYTNNYKIMDYVIADFKTSEIKMSFSDIYELLNTTNLNNQEKGLVLRNVPIDDSFFAIKNADNEIIESALINNYLNIDNSLRLYNFAFEHKMYLAAISIVERMIYRKEIEEIPNLFALLENSIEAINEYNNEMYSLELIYEYMVQTPHYNNQIQNMATLELKYYNALKTSDFIAKYSKKTTVLLIQSVKRFFKDDYGKSHEEQLEKFLFIYDLVQNLYIEFYSANELLKWSESMLSDFARENYYNAGKYVLAKVMANIYEEKEHYFFEAMSEPLFKNLDDKFYSELSTGIYNIDHREVRTVNPNDPTFYQTKSIKKFQISKQKSIDSKNDKLTGVYNSLIETNESWKNQEEENARTKLRY